MTPLAWLRRLGVASGTALASYAIMIGILVSSAIYDASWGPYLKTLNLWNVEFKRWLGEHAKDSYFALILVNAFRTHINLVHVLLSIPAIIIAGLSVGMTLNRVLGGTRTWFQRLGIALCSVPVSLLIAIALFATNVWSPTTYAKMLDYAEVVWQGTLRFLESNRDAVPGLGKAINIIYQGHGGHSFVFMAAAGLGATFVMNALFAWLFRPQKPKRVYRY